MRGKLLPLFHLVPPCPASCKTPYRTGAQVEIVVWSSASLMLQILDRSKNMYKEVGTVEPAQFKCRASLQGGRLTRRFSFGRLVSHFLRLFLLVVGRSGWIITELCIVRGSDKKIVKGL